MCGDGTARTAFYRPTEHDLGTDVGVDGGERSLPRTCDAKPDQLDGRARHPIAHASFLQGPRRIDARLVPLHQPNWVVRLIRTRRDADQPNERLPLGHRYAKRPVVVGRPVGTAPLVPRVSVLTHTIVIRRFGRVFTKVVMMLMAASNHPTLRIPRCRSIKGVARASNSNCSSSARVTKPPVRAVIRSRYANADERKSASMSADVIRAACGRVGKRQAHSHRETASPATLSPHSTRDRTKSRVWSSSK